ncbi:MAG: hypothetical protein NC120_12425 [Ruminococcus sp.]|nr:hypothetical protein [Ruminococcus sp.]
MDGENELILTTGEERSYNFLSKVLSCRKEENSELISIVRDPSVPEDICRRALECIENDRNTFRTIAFFAAGAAVTYFVIHGRKVL